MTISATIQQFVDQAIQDHLLDPLDSYYVRNRLLALLKLDELEAENQAEPRLDSSLLELMDRMVTYALENGIIQDLSYEREQLEAAIMDLITPKPSQVNQTFQGLYDQDPVAATDYFYRLSQANDYIKTRHIAKNIEFKTPYKDYGDLDITINLSKPEKDPKEIALAKTMKASNYPLCLLCMENEGYQGRSNHPARQQHRIVRLDLGGQAYGMQYSPYSYYNEHAIFLSQDHVPMKIDRAALDHLLAIVEVLPHYFAGSNADLPIVGGSILAHDHYQGGRYSFPMERAGARQDIQLTGFEDIKAVIVNWPMSVIRLTGPDKDRIAQAGQALLDFWRQYSDPDCQILAFTADTPHNTVTPVARRRGQDYELDVVLRNNRTDASHPDGIFHPHQDVQHIKKENIGLIEVMGLAILPPRLVSELAAVKAFIQGQGTLEDVAAYHRDWAQSLKEELQASEPDKLDRALELAVGQKFGRVLEDAGVYKQDPQGQAGFMRFVTAFNNR